VNIIRLELRPTVQRVGSVEVSSALKATAAAAVPFDAASAFHS